MFRTPAKSTRDSESEMQATTAGPVTEPTVSSRPNVRRSIGEWESGKPETRVSLSPTNKTFLVESPKAKPVAARRLSAEASGSPPKRPAKTSDRVAEAKSCVTKAKIHLANSRNLKTDIKLAVTQAIDRLFQLVKESEVAKGHLQPKSQVRDKAVVMEESASSSAPPGPGLEELMKRHMALITENTEKVDSLNEALGRELARGHGDAQTGDVGKLLNEVRELRVTAEATERRVSSMQEAVPSYAEVLARPAVAASPSKLRPKHSIIVSSGEEMDTSEEVLGRVREALDAKTSGLRVTRVQKVKNQKVVLSCDTREELKKVSEKIAAQNKNLKIEEARNKDPLIIIKNILRVHKDEEIVASLKTQNASLLENLTDHDFRAVVKYRRRARNPHENHVVLQVSPPMWQKLTAARRIHVDLQYAVVEDQSPLVQCTRCLGYGHGRRLCTEPVDLCSFCAGPHLRADCPAYLTGETATCRNCRLAKYHELGHNAFDGECPVRKRWDAIARSSVAYC